MKTVNIKLLINKKKVNIGCEFLVDLIRYMPDIKQNQDVFESLAVLENHYVKYFIAEKTNLNKKTIKALLTDSNEEIVNEVLSNKNLAKYIPQKRIMKIIKSESIYHICTIARFVENYKKCDIYKLIKIFSNHRNPQVRHKLLKSRNSDLIPNKILKKLSKDPDIDVSSLAKTLIKNSKCKRNESKKISFRDF